MRRALRALGRAWPARRGPRDLAEDESGSIIIFSLFVFVIMLALGGLGLDTMRTEARRTHLQATIDRAVLAAADLQQTQDPEAVVRDMLVKAGYPADLAQVRVVRTVNSRTVQASAMTPVPTMFLKMIGINSFEAPATGTATESVTDVEIGLVLDVSGSMRGSKLTNLKLAGADFVDAMFDGIEPENLSISLIPYSSQVNLGPQLASAAVEWIGQMPVPPRLTDIHGYSFCFDVPSSAYTSPMPWGSGTIDQAGHFDRTGFPNPNQGNAEPYPDMDANNLSCRYGDSFEVYPWSNNPNALKNRIDGFSAEGMTSIEMGVNWGLALLDPVSRRPLERMADRGQVSDDLRGWPRDYMSPEGMKILVVMTDGQSTNNYLLKSPYNTNALSDVWLAGTDEYYVAAGSKGFFNAKFADDPAQKYVAAPPPGATQLRWPDLFNRMSVVEHAKHLRYAEDNKNSTWKSWTSIVETTTRNEKDKRISRICETARDRGVVVFTIGFEVDEHAANVMADCASSPSHFYRVEGLEIRSAFTSIASQVNALRLIQ